MLKLLRKRNSSLQSIFIGRVLTPPFLLLILCAIFCFWQLDHLLRDQATDTLKSAADATAIRLDREFAIRETVLKRTGEEMFVVKSKYNSDVASLEKNRNDCRTYYESTRNFAGAPGDACLAFSDNLGSSAPNLALLEDNYVTAAEQLQTSYRQGINQRLSAFKQFFPETMVLLVLDKDEVTSSAVSGAIKSSTDGFVTDAKSAGTQPIYGKVMPVDSYNLAVFAYPISGGSVLAAFDINNDNFLRNSWQNTPIDSKRAITVILDSSGQLVFPELKDGKELSQHSAELRSSPVTQIKISDVPNFVAANELEQSKWLVAVASPRAVVLEPVRNAQILIVLVIALVITGFLWLGTFFIRRMTDNVTKLVTGAMVFGSGRLDYKIDLPHAETEIKQLADTMNYMARRISDTEKAMDEKNKEFISIATHELRAPMAAIIGYLSMFKEKHDKNLDQKSKQQIDEAYYGTTRLKDLINDMLDIARLEGGKVELNLVPVELEKTVEDVVSTQSTVAEMAHIKLDYDKKDAGLVLCDENRLRIVITNLISNAIKYNKPNGTIKVSHVLGNDEITTKVEDSGLGIPEEQKEHIFEKFYRVDHDDRKNVTGTGLGMHITKRYVEEMNGKIWFESKHGVGTTFFVSLPVGHGGEKQVKQIVSDGARSSWIMRWRKRLR